MFASCQDDVLQVSMGDVVIALSGAKAGSSGGRDGLVAEMLLTLPWRAVVLFRHLFHARFRSNSRDSAMEADCWKHYMATWIQKDRESDLLSSFRPILQSSVVMKWLERLCLGPRPELALLSRAPLWEFRPGLSAAQLAIAAQLAARASLNHTSRSVSSADEPSAG